MILELNSQHRFPYGVITELLEAHRPHMVMWWQGCICLDGQDNPGWSPQRHSEHVTELIAQAAEEYYRPRIETVEQLDALPVGTVIYDADLNVHERLGSWSDEDGPYGLFWGTVGIAAPVIPSLPVIVLWSPGAGE